MLPLQALMAIDLANERSREAAALSEGRRVAQLVADEMAEHPDLYPARPGPARRLLAFVLHRVEGGASTVARAACEAATRLDGSTA